MTRGDATYRNCVSFVYSKETCTALLESIIASAGITQGSFSLSNKQHGKKPFCSLDEYHEECHTKKQLSV
jgi:hypothetical protein